MKNIAIIFLISGLAILTTTPASAIPDWERKQNEAAKERRDEQERQWRREQRERDNPPGKGISPTTPYYNDGGGNLDGLGALFGAFNFGPSTISSNGNIQYGVQSKFGFENIRVRTGMHFGSGSSITGAFTYSLSGQPTMFNPFIGGGLGVKSIQQVGNSESNAFSFYGTGGVDLNILDNLSITGAVNLPTNTTYGTEFQVGINFFGGF